MLRSVLAATGLAATTGVALARAVVTAGSVALARTVVLALTRTGVAAGAVVLARAVVGLTTTGVSLARCA